MKIPAEEKFSEFYEKGSGWGSLARLMEEQGRKIEELRLRVRLEEERVEGEIDRQQVGLAAGRLWNCGLCQVEYIERDSRCPESVDFLAGTCMLQIQLRQWGKRR
ncbi:hypothetical protein SLA2020_515650 [Shorea laevis]